MNLAIQPRQNLVRETLGSTESVFCESFQQITVSIVILDQWAIAYSWKAVIAEAAELPPLDKGHLNPVLSCDFQLSVPVADGE